MAPRNKQKSTTSQKASSSTPNLKGKRGSKNDDTPGSNVDLVKKDLPKRLCRRNSTQSVPGPDIFPGPEKENWKVANNNGADKPNKKNSLGTKSDKSSQRGTSQSEDSIVSLKQGKDPFSSDIDEKKTTSECYSDLKVGSSKVLSQERASANVYSKEALPTTDFSRSDNVAQQPLCSQVWPDFHRNNKNMAHYVSRMALGRISPSHRKAFVDEHIVSKAAEIEVIDYHRPFGSRVTTVDWHPRKRDHFCVTSKHGDLGFYKINADGERETVKIYPGTGPGGYISAFKYHPTDSERFYTSTLEGKVVVGNLEKSGSHVEKVLLSTGTWDFWYCGMEVSLEDNFVVASRNNGWTVMCSTAGERIWELRLHSKKITHVELSPREPHILCTASLDHTVCLWDLRMLRELKGKPIPTEKLLHEKGINSAYFSLTDGTRLLTTDQHDQIRVYRAPFWHLETTILHPHRFFRHLTPHKAAWHPLADKIVCGRYPGDINRPEYGNERTIDMFDAASGQIESELKDPQLNGLISLCKFNKTGDKLLTSMGFSFCVWAHRTVEDDDLQLPGGKAQDTKRTFMKDVNKARKKLDSSTKMKFAKLKKKE